jgi:hypothetical protein
MTDRFIAFTVTLLKPTREDDADNIRHALQMVKGVDTVVPVVADTAAFYAEQHARSELIGKLFEVLQGDGPNGRRG